MQTAGAESEMDVLHADTGADVGDATAIEMSASESALQQESYTRSFAAFAKAMVTYKSAANRIAESKAK